MKFTLSLLFVSALSSAAFAEETPIQTMAKSPGAAVINGSTKLSLADALASALQHAENEKLTITQNCTGTVQNATTRMETCAVNIGKSQAGQINGVCGDYGKGTYFFRFTRANVAGTYQLSDIQLQISLR